MCIKNKILTAVVAVTFSAFATAQTAESFKQPYPLGSKLSPNPNFMGDVWLSAVTKEKELNVPIANISSNIAWYSRYEIIHATFLNACLRSR